MKQVYLICFLNEENGTTTYGGETITINKIDNMKDAIDFNINMIEAICKKRVLNETRTVPLSITLIYEE